MHSINSLKRAKVTWQKLDARGDKPLSGSELPWTPSGRVLRVKGRGVAGRHGTGDLLARVQVVVPQRLTDAAREAVEALRAEEADLDPRAGLFERAES